MTKRSETFGRLLKAGISSIANVEGKTAPVVEDDLGQQIGIAGYTIQRYKSGHLPLEARTVQILAEACVQRGYLGRIWLERFLQVAQFPAPAPLLDRLCPQPVMHARPPRIYENLPAPTYSQFVWRAQAFAEIIEGLRQRSAVVLLVGLGGNGKTSLVREVATRCLSGVGNAPKFDAIVWVSDKDRPGATNLSTVLDEIARTLDYPGIAQYEFEEKQREVEQLLKLRQVLLVVDNLETITDAALVGWLVRMPEPSKALVTSRSKPRALWNSWLVEVDGMRPDEAHELITQRLRAVRLDKGTGDLQQFAPLIAVTGGNPQAIEMALGLMKHARRTTQQVVDDLAAARGELFDDLCVRAWALLDQAARRVVLVMTFFPASASDAALRAAADVHALPFDRAVERLTDLGLLEVQQVDLSRPARYLLHPLVRAFAAVQLAEQPAFAAKARERWVAWCLELAAQVGFRWDDLRRLDLLDPEHETIHAALLWTFEQQRYPETIQLIEGVRYYYNVRGLWDHRLSMNLLRAEAARQLGNPSDEALALAHQVEIRSKQGSFAEAEHYVPRLQELAQNASLSDDAAFEVGHSLALYAWARGDLPAAERQWRALLRCSEQLGGQKYVVNRRWLATCLYQQGMREAARALYRDSLHDAIQIGDLRSVIGNRIKLAILDREDGNIERAAALLDACYSIADQHQDRRRLGEIQRQTAEICMRRGDTAAAYQALNEATDMFERMGMRRELAEVRQAIERLANG
jgi:tetratricopeptide (TPR) repeat protein